ncbi:hypothetical protein V6N13_055111 [Hibiscus sabdariffa]
MTSSHHAPYALGDTRATMDGTKGRDPARKLTPAQCRKVKEVGDLMTGEPATEAPVNGGRNYNGPKVAKFLVGLGGRRRRPPSGAARAISEIPLWKS